MARRSSHLTDRTRGQGHDEDCDHDIGRAIAFGGVVKDLNEREKRLRLHDGIGITEAETQREDHNEAQNRIQHYSPRDGPRQCFRGILNLFGYWRDEISVASGDLCDCAALTHMHAAVEAQHRHDGCRQANHDRCARGAPPSSVGELGEDGFRSVPGCKDPQWDDDRKETNDVYYQYQSFHHRQLFSQESVEKNGERGDRNDQHCAMPALEDIAWVV